MIEVVGERVREFELDSLTPRAGDIVIKVGDAHVTHLTKTQVFCSGECFNFIDDVILQLLTYSCFERIFLFD